MGSGEEESDKVSMGPSLWAGSRETGGARNPRPLDVHSECETQLSVFMWKQHYESTTGGLDLG